MYFVPVEDPAGAVKVTRIAENSPTKIIGVGVKTNYAHNRLEIRTQFNGSGKPLKTPRTITSSFVLEDGKE